MALCHSLPYRSILRQRYVLFLKDLNVQEKCVDEWKRFYLLGRPLAPKEPQKEGVKPWLRLGKPDGSQSMSFSVYTDFFSRIMIILFLSLFFTLPIVIRFPDLSVKMWYNSPFKHYFHLTHTQNSILTITCFQSSDDSLIFDTQLINWLVDTLSITIGMNLWFAPQISEHCPYRRPGRLIENLTWFSRSCVASVFTPSLGTLHECSTSAAVTIIQIGEFMGRTIRLYI